MDPNLLLSFYLFITALFSALIMVPSLRRWALETGSLDQPGGRKVHSEATPRLGGVAIFVSFLFSLLLFKEFNLEVRGIIGGGLVVFFTGLADDLYGLPPKQKFFGQILGSLIAVLVGDLYISNLGNLFGFGDLILPVWVAIPFTVFSVVGVINSINLIDGLDGLAGGISAIALGTFFIMDYHSGSGETMLLCAALLGALLGFLKFNTYPARIFMGDVGSLVVGFVLAFLAIKLTQNPGQMVSPVLPVIILGLPIIDTLWVMGRRILHGGSPFVADQTHLHHKFLNLGFQHRFTVLIIYGISLFWGVFAVLFHQAPEYLLVLSYLLGTGAFYMVLRLLLKFRDRFAFFQKDSQSSLRNTEIFKALAWLGDGSVVLLKLLVGLFLVAAVLAGASLPNGAAGLVLVVLIAGVTLTLLTRDTSQHLLFAVLYMTGMVLVALVDQSGSHSLLGGFKLGGATNLLFALMAPLIALKLMFRRQGESFLSTPFEFLILAMSASLVIVSPELTLAYNLPWVIGKAILLFLALRIIAMQSGELRRPVFGMVFGTLGFMILRSFLL